MNATFQHKCTPPGLERWRQGNGDPEQTHRLHLSIQTSPFKPKALWRGKPAKNRPPTRAIELPHFDGVGSARTGWEGTFLIIWFKSQAKTGSLMCKVSSALVRWDCERCIQCDSGGLGREQVGLHTIVTLGGHPTQLPWPQSCSL